MKLTITLTVIAVIAAVPAAPQSLPPAGPKLTLSNVMIRGYTAIQRDLLKPPS
jgi:hypothetical protein